MANLETIKQAPDVVVTHRYDNGRLVATEYKSSLGIVVDRYDQKKEPLHGNFKLDESIVSVENEPKMDESIVSAEYKPKRR